MNDFVFYSPTQFVLGRGVTKKVGDMVAQYDGKRVLIVYGGGSILRSGLLQRVEGLLSKRGIYFVEMGGIKPNPVDTKVYEGIDLVRSEGVDFLLPIGGGSVIDTAKAIACGVPYDGDFWDFYCGKVSVETAMPIGVILTIPAAGSEGSGNSVITKIDGLRKLSLRTLKALRPRFALMDPEVTFTLPAWQTAAGITDMMAHIMERYFSNTKQTQVADRMCEGVLKAIIEEAPKVMANPTDYDARANIMWAGTIAHNGTCGVGCEEDWASHYLEHEISAVYNVTHGAGLAVVFPAWLTYMADHNVAKVAQFAERVWDVAPAAPRNMAIEGIKRFKEFLRGIGMPVTFAQLGIETPDIDLLVSKLHENKGDLIGSYVRLDHEATKTIYTLAL